MNLAVQRCNGRHFSLFNFLALSVRLVCYGLIEVTKSKRPIDFEDVDIISWHLTLITTAINLSSKMLATPSIIDSASKL